MRIQRIHKLCACSGLLGKVWFWFVCWILSLLSALVRRLANNNNWFKKECNSKKVYPDVTWHVWEILQFCWSVLLYFVKYSYWLWKKLTEGFASVRERRGSFVMEKLHWSLGKIRQKERLTSCVTIFNWRSMRSTQKNSNNLTLSWKWFGELTQNWDETSFLKFEITRT